VHVHCHRTQRSSYSTSSPYSFHSGQNCDPSAADSCPCLERDIAQLVRGKTDDGTIFFVQLGDLPGECAAKEIPGIGKTRVFPEEGTRVRAQGIIGVVHEEGQDGVSAT